MQPIPNQSNSSAMELDSIKSDDSRKLGKCSKKLWIIISIIAAVVIAAVIVIVIVVMKKKDKTPKKVKDPIPTNNPEPTVVIEPTNKPLPTNEPEPTNKPVPTDKPEPTNKPVPTDKPEPTDIPEPIDQGPLETEFSINTIQGEKKRISVFQVSNDESKFNGQSIKTNVKTINKIIRRYKGNYI